MHKNQRGFTLIELLIAVAITALIAGGIATSIFQIFAMNARTSNHMIAVRQVQSAGYWISRDAQMAQSVNTTAPDGFLRLTWTDWAGTAHLVTYSIIDGDLIRSESGNVTLVARHIDPVRTNWDWNVYLGKLTLEVTASVDAFGAASENRTYEIVPRPSS